MAGQYKLVNIFRTALQPSSSFITCCAVAAAVLTATEPCQWENGIFDPTP